MSHDDEDDRDEGIREGRGSDLPRRRNDDERDRAPRSGGFDRDREEFDDHDERRDQRAREKTNVPGIFLIVCGALNALFLLYFLANTIYILVQSPEAMLEQQTKLAEMFGVKNQLPDQDGEALKLKQVLSNIGLTAMSLAGTILPLMAGVKMRNLSSYGLSMTGAICAAIPCISGSSCCLLGIGAGIWAIVVLLDAEVKSAFR